MPASPDDGSALTRSTKVIAVADVVESVRLMEQDEQEFIRRWQKFVGFVRQRVPADSGRLHKSLGDGLMLEFSDAEGCVRAALAMRAWFADANLGLTPEDQVQLRIGAHVAEFVADEHDIYGTDVNLAARIASLAGPGEIVISAALREQLAPQWRAETEDLGTCHLKHVKEPVHAFRIGHAGQAPVLPLRRLATHTLRPTLAVLPFGIAGQQEADDLTGEALGDDIVAALAHSDQLQVASRLSTAPFAGGKARLEEVRRVTGAHYVLTGRARRHGHELDLFVELADAVSGHVAWAQSFRGPLRQASLNDGRLMREIVAALHSAVLAQAMERGRTEPLPSLEGYTLLLAAIGLMHSLSAAELARARGMLEHLVDRGRGHPAPHAWLAHLHVLGLRQGGARTSPEAHLAREHARDALQCDPGSPLALSMDGQACLYGAEDADTAEERYAQALTARPDDSLAHLLHGELLALRGEGQLALQAARHAMERTPLEPLRYLYDSTCGLAALVALDAQGAATLAQRAVERNPRYVPALRTLIAALVRGGRLAEAQRHARRWAQRQAGLNVTGLLASLPACDEVRQLFAQALEEAGVRKD